MRDARAFCLRCLTPAERAGDRCDCGRHAGPEDVETHPDALPPGTVLAGQYVVGRHLGRGGFGVTYIGADLQLGLRVAIKEFFPRDLAARDRTTQRVVPIPGDEAAAFAEGLPRFLDEGRVLVRFFDHPNMVSVLNFFEANGTGYLVMRYLDGRTAEEERLAGGGRVAEPRALEIVRGALAGLEAVHAADLLHRDVKPANIFVTLPKGARESNGVKLIDFGAARYFVGRSRPFSLVWTPGFAAPEQVAGSDDQGPWTDVFGAGATLYTLLAGSPLPPYKDPSRPIKFKTPSEVLGSGVSRHVSDAVVRGVKHGRRERFQSVREFSEALGRRDDRSQHVAPPPPPPPPPPQGGHRFALKGIRGEYAGFEVPLTTRDEVVIGRDPDRCNLVLDGGTAGVSRCHVVIRSVPGSRCVLVMDPQSACGTWLDDFGPIEKRKWYEVSPGQRIRVGGPDVVFEVVAVPEA